MKIRKTLQITTNENDQDKRLDRFLVEQSEINSRSFAQSLIEKNMILINDKVAKASAKLKANQKITIHLPEDTVTEILPFDLKLDIIFEDNDLIVLNKPSGLVVHPSAGHEQDTLVNALLAHTDQLSMKNEIRPGIVHRIDKETSGLLVVAKNDVAHESLAEQFKNKTTHRIYYAITEGKLEKQKGTIQSYLARHPSDRKKISSLRSNNKIIQKYNQEIENGKWAITHYEVLQNTANNSYVKLKLETGRTHQIRVHMKELGHPLVGDLTYGYSALKNKKHGYSRFFLHAAELGFQHPKTDQMLIFKCNWPDQDRIKIQNLGFKHDLPGM